MRFDGAKKIMSFDLLYPAIIVFSLLVIGLVLTILEFTKMKKNDEAKELDNRRKNK